MRASHALELFVEGRTYQDIANLAGYPSRQRAHEAVQRELAKMSSERRERAFSVDAARTQHLWETFYALARQGDTQAAAVCVRLLERRAKMYGYDQERNEAAANAGQVVILDVVREAAVTEVAS